jgi:hypothetical protein
MQPGWDVLQMMTVAGDLPTERFVDYSLSRVNGEFASVITRADYAARDGLRILITILEKAKIAMPRGSKPDRNQAKGAADASAVRQTRKRHSEMQHSPPLPRTRKFRRSSSCWAS